MSFSRNKFTQATELINKILMSSENMLARAPPRCIPFIPKGGN